MSTTEWPARVVPAQLSFLAIYNPTLGPTDDTFRDQLVFYYSRVAGEARAAARKDGRGDGGVEARVREEENERLRQIGLAQGMVDFARTFSNGEPVDSIETEKSRIVLHEIEKGWWILASIDLTQLPSLAVSDSSKGNDDKAEVPPTVEYSSREVSPPALLVQQLRQAHSIFCLHHGPSLDELFVRLPRDKFCNTLDRFWSRFSKGWDVLLHGNPAVDILNGVKLASGGELGYGVGEEEWGSGEREVLEDLTRRTEGLEDVLVARFGDPAPADTKQMQDDEALPWIGTGGQAIASDGLVFSGVGSLTRHSIRDVSLWMREIYTYGEYAYGVRDNPLRERRKRKRKAPQQTRPSNGSTIRPKVSPPVPDLADQPPKGVDVGEATTTPLEGVSVDIPPPKDGKPEMQPGVTSHDRTRTSEETPTPPLDGTKPNIPPPIVTAAEKALERATRNADKSASEREDEDGDAEEEDAATTLGIPDQYMKYLTFGLSTLGKPTPKRPTSSRQSSSSIPAKASNATKRQRKPKSSEPPVMDTLDPDMAHIDPMPDGETLRSKIANQIRQENRGYFVVGLAGDLDAPTDDEDVELTDSSLHRDSDGSRIVLRTIQLDMVRRAEDTPVNEQETTVPDFETGIEATNNYRRRRVLIYAHRPFIYCFLFKDRTPSLQYGEFYRSLHQILSPIRKALLSSTDVSKVAQRIEDAHAANNSQSDKESASESLRNTLPSKGASTEPIFDLIYDPRLLTVHTSIPNIPVPGTPAAEGIFTGVSAGSSAQLPAWTRLEALNVHSQVLNTLQSVKTRKNEIERTSKTSRGWWVVWMKLPPSDLPIAASDDGAEAASQVTQESAATLPSEQPISVSGEATPFQPVLEEKEDLHRIAFLVRKASDASSASKSTSTSSRAVSSLFGNMSLGLGGRSSRSDDPTGGASAGWGPAALAGGIGVDARRYVEGLLSLNR